MYTSWVLTVLTLFAVCAPVFAEPAPQDRVYTADQNSNTVSVILFIAAGQVAWMIAIVMGLCNIFGAWIGTHMALKHGARVIRPLLIIVSLALTLKMLLDPANPIRGLLVR